MARAERAMVMATKRAMASNDNNNDRDNNGKQNNSGNKDYDAAAAAAANNNDNKDDEDENEDTNGAAVAAGGFVGGGSISGRDCGGVGGGGFGRWQIVAGVGVVLCRTTTTMHGIHYNQPEEGLAAKIPVTDAKLQATSSRCDKRIRGRHNTNASAMTARRRWQQW